MNYLIQNEIPSDYFWVFERIMLFLQHHLNPLVSIDLKDGRISLIIIIRERVISVQEVVMSTKMILSECEFYHPETI